ncbi:putative glycosyltransferase family 69 protein [Erysiphe neolycopersici]|uniref:Putative glycosyltransferase family 69 protein n=1 Tax=Erysiphe neolycopersici TaxID=212602 RepID=A0A420H6V1_9PEZI|nr:putative glycosyltransferase family 69 protein [Erysiphe neolycopersici]
MTFPQPNYERLPRLSSDLFHEAKDFDFSEKPTLHHYFSLQFRKTRRILSLFRRSFNLLSLFLVLLAVQLIFNGSYLESNAPKFTPDSQEKIFIAANIADGDLIDNAWGSSLLSLVDLIGSDRVFVSIYGLPTTALSQLEKMLKCEHKIVSEELEPVSLDTLPRTLLPNGDRRIKRISFLAEIRNKALHPLAELEKKGTKFDKILFINDVFFNPSEALRLMWGTNVNIHGKAEYKAACAADFISSWKYYDTFATRDAEGYSMGLPIFPWFSSKGGAASRKDVLAGRDSVRVKSCWGGMVSFDARYFMSTIQENPEAITSTSHSSNFTFPVRFRSEPEAFWDASECCLVHADIMALPSFYHPSPSNDNLNTGIFMNPYVRTAYSAQALFWIPFTKRFERLMAPIQWIINLFAKLPRYNYRRLEKPGQIIDDRVWVNYNTTQNVTDIDQENPRSYLRHTKGDSLDKSGTFWLKYGYYKDFQRPSTQGGYCGVRQLMVLREKGYSKEDNGKGGKNWDNLLDSVPPLIL